MMERRFVDAEARRRAVSDLDRSFCVEAGAGTGKTTLLVDRYLEIVSSGKARCGQIVAITFTEKAAGEMKYRLRRRIAEHLSSSATDGDVRTRLEEAYIDLERAPISTIHSFAAAILREQPLEAGVDPIFRQLDGVEAPLFLDECWGDFLASMPASSAHPIGRFFAYGGRLGHLHDMALALYDRRGERYVDGLFGSGNSRALEENARESAEGEDPAEAFRGVVGEAATRLSQLVSEHCINRADRGCIGIGRLLEAIEGIEDLSGETLEEFLLELPFPSKRDGNKSNWSPGTACSRVKEIVGGLHDSRDEFVSAVTDRLNGELSALFDEFLAFVEQRKAAESFLDFDDLLIRTRELLRDEHALTSLRDRYRFFLVDEFQDTDPLQAEIVFLLAGGGDDPEAGRLFIVGDPKQSIYRFRRADVEIYEAVKERLAESGSHLHISQNFRSVPSIVKWVNATFGEIMTPPAHGMYQPLYEPIRETRGEDLHAIAELDLGLEDSRTNASDIRRAEGEAIARLIRKLVEESPPVRDPKTKLSRPLSYRDIAVIYPGTTGIDYYEQPLRREDIPYIIEGGKLYYTRQEVRDVAAVLRAIEDPWDQLAIVAALRSPLFGFSDEELYLFKSAGGTFDYLGSVAPEIGSCRDFTTAFRFMADLHQSRNSVGPVGTIRALLRETNFLEFCLLRPHGEQRIQNIRKALQNARGFEARGFSFGRFVRWLGDQESLTTAEAESPLVEEDEDAVRLLTVHKAKGLQFPVVILANLAQRRSRKARLYVVGGKRLAFKIGGMKTGDYDATSQGEEQKDEAETIRLLYVAATRAGDLLVVPRSPKANGKSYFELIEDGLSREPFLLRWGVGELPPLKGSARAFTRRLRKGGVRERNRWLAGRERMIERAARSPLVVTPSGVVQHESGGSPGVGDGDASRRFGLAFHHMMELLDISLENVPDALARAVAARYGLAGSDELRDLAEKTLHSELLREAASSNRRLCEVPFTLVLDGGFLEGRIDLIYRSEGSWRIVDYKTDDLSRQAVDDRFDSYRMQGACYALAASRLGIGPVDSVVFYFVRPGEQRRIAVTEELLIGIEADLDKLSSGQ
jgi:ATP-dependent helicase/nuclease subunit A